MAVPAGVIVAIELPVIHCPTCETPYVLRLCHALRGTQFVTEWMFQRDCSKRHPFLESGEPQVWAPAGFGRTRDAS